jgi:hypothetical protein
LVARKEISPFLHFTKWIPYVEKYVEKRSLHGAPEPAIGNGPVVTDYEEKRRLHVAPEPAVGHGPVVTDYCRRSSPNAPAVTLYHRRVSVVRLQ